jgi:plasmid stabilization system protein ParE
VEEGISRETFRRVSRYTLSRKARRDVFEVWLYIAKDSVDVADQVETAIFQNCELLAENPRIGKLTVKATKRPLLSWPAVPYMNYLIFYELRPRGITIVRIVRGERDLPKLLGF